jgi:hypothetical protein
MHWSELLGFILLLMLTFVAAGTLIGTLVRRQQAVIPLSIGLSIPIFFISGAFGPATWGDPVTAIVFQSITVSRFFNMHFIILQLRL